MRIKRFIASNMRQALQCVRKEQGPDAVILSNRRVEGGIEVVAAVDYDETLINPALSGVDQNDTAHTQTAGESEADDVLFASDTMVGIDDTATVLDLDARWEDAAPDAEKWSRESALGAIREEIKGMRALLSDQLSTMAWGTEVKRDPATVSMLRRMAAMGIDADIARQIAAEPEEGDSCLERSTRTLAGALPILDDTVLDEGGVIAVIGPTGVGKTTSIAKLAARFALRHGRDQVALVSTDSFRIGAQEQLATFAQILDIPVHRVTDKDELGTLLAGLTDKRLVLIDTAGVSQRVQGLAEHLSAFSEGGTRIQTYLALAANGHSQTLDEVVRKFGCVPLDGCILTKVDEAACLGAAFSAVIRHQLPIAFLANGQRVPEDLHAAAGRNVALVNYATRLMRESGRRVGDEFMARNFAEVRAHAYA